MKKIFNKIGVILTIFLCLIVAFLLWFNVEYFGALGIDAALSDIGIRYAL